MSGRGDLAVDERPETDLDSAYRRAQTVRERYQAELMSKANVVGVGVGLRNAAGENTQEIALVVLVSKKVPRAQLAERDLVPQVLEGVPVDVQEVGEINAHAGPRS
jgi:hypothetical protein